MLNDDEMQRLARWMRLAPAMNKEQLQLLLGMVRKIRTANQWEAGEETRFIRAVVEDNKPSKMKPMIDPLPPRPRIPERVVDQFKFHSDRFGWIERLERMRKEAEKAK
jgi:hypothetical protein